ncbi:hypothetical protein CgunFtcFv8_010401 [Champsocephalus gunnari]|uniref:VWFA domain-containing protein n=1 Tax=Champsocephalus gunnari TaxID=52237 RepID=A0AAN8DTU5_CHAGU|nr:hypothetical protein CgunFtcFv8_010401 [Champsocephalus gunnari]
MYDDPPEAKPELPRRDPLLQLVSLQRASGRWELDPAVAAALGKTSKEVENTQPSEVNKEVWATILALIWLHGFKMDAQEEWELLARKAVSWLRAQNGSAGGSVQVTSVPASLVPYSLSFSARVSSPRPVSKVESNCPLDPLEYLNTEQSQATVKLAAGHKFDRDVELLIYYKDAHQPTAVVEAGQTSAKSGTLMGDPVVMLSLYPEFPQAVMSSLASCGEFVFLLDRSGSMQRDRIKSARDTLLLLLKSLPMGCFFNIYSFGSSHEHVFPKSVEYSQETMEEALKKVGEMEANLGGTEILRPLKDK